MEDRRSAPRPLLQLSAIELDTLKALAAGLTVSQVAAIRYVSEDTVKTQRKRLYAKLGVPNGMLAVAHGYCWGILNPDEPPELAFEQHERYPKVDIEREKEARRALREAREERKAKFPRKGVPGGKINRRERVLADLAAASSTDELYARFPALAMLEKRSASGVARVSAD